MSHFKSPLACWRPTAWYRALCSSIDRSHKRYCCWSSKTTLKYFSPNSRKKVVLLAPHVRILEMAKSNDVLLSSWLIFIWPCRGTSTSWEIFQNKANLVKIINGSQQIHKNSTYNTTLFPDDLLCFSKENILVVPRKKIEFPALLDQTNEKNKCVEYVQFLGVDWKHFRWCGFCDLAFWFLRLQNSRLFISNSYTPEQHVPI